MAEHPVRRNGIIYIIPNDELFQKWKDGGAFIDDYGHLVECKSHKVMKPLKRYADNPSKEQMQSVPQSPTSSWSSLVQEWLKNKVYDKVIEYADIAIDGALDKLFYKVIPCVWREHIVPTFYDMKDALSAKEIKALSITQDDTDRNSTEIIPQHMQPSLKMTEEEIDVQKRKVVYHWLAILESLRKLQSAEVTDMNVTLEQLTNPVMLQKINSYLDANPKLLEMDEYLTLRELLGRDLYEEKQFVPIQAKEIEIIAATYEQEATAEKSED